MALARWVGREEKRAGRTTNFAKFALLHTATSFLSTAAVVRSRGGRMPWKATKAKEGEPHPAVVAPAPPAAALIEAEVDELPRDILRCLVKDKLSDVAGGEGTEVTSSWGIPMCSQCRLWGSASHSFVVEDVRTIVLSEVELCYRYIDTGALYASTGCRVGAVQDGQQQSHHHRLRP